MLAGVRQNEETLGEGAKRNAPQQRMYNYITACSRNLSTTTWYIIHRRLAKTDGLGGYLRSTHVDTLLTEKAKKYARGHTPDRKGSGMEGSVSSVAVAVAVVDPSANTACDRDISFSSSDPSPRKTNKNTTRKNFFAQRQRKAFIAQRQRIGLRS